MHPASQRFLSAILGERGFQALQTTIDREPGLAPILVPRAALAWIRTRDSYGGEIPGSAEYILRFQKSDTGYSGWVGDFDFKEVTPERLAALLSVAVGVEPQEARVREPSLWRLGKSIDALVGAQVLQKALQKADLPGVTAKPFEQQGPTAPAAPQKQPRGAKPPKPKLPKLPGLRVSKSEAMAECPACGGQQFHENRFRGCICLRSFQKAVKTTVYGDGFVLDFDAEFPRAALLVLRKALGF